MSEDTFHPSTPYTSLSTKQLWAELGRQAKRRQLLETNGLSARITDVDKKIVDLTLELLTRKR